MTKQEKLKQLLKIDQDPKGAILALYKQLETLSEAQKSILGTIQDKSDVSSLYENSDLLFKEIEEVNIDIADLYSRLGSVQDDHASIYVDLTRIDMDIQHLASVIGSTTIPDMPTVINGTDGYTPIKGIDYFDGEKGEQGDHGEIGPMPKHQWDGTNIRFEIAPDEWGQWVNLQGFQSQTIVGGTTSLKIANSGTLIGTQVKNINFGAGLNVSGNRDAVTITADTDYLDDFFLTELEADSRYLQISNNLSDLGNVSTARTNLGLVAGGAGDIWVEKTGDTMTGNLNMGGNSIIGNITGSGGNLTLRSNPEDDGDILLGESLIVEADGSGPGAQSLSILKFANGDRIYAQTLTDRMFYTSDRFEVLSKDGAETIAAFNSSASANADSVLFYKGIASGTYAGLSLPSNGAAFSGRLASGTNSAAAQFHVSTIASTETMRVQGRSDFGSIQFYNSTATRRGIIGYDSGGGFVTGSLTNSLIIRGENGITFGDAATQIASMFFDGTNRRLGAYGETFLSFGHTTDITDPRAYVYWDETDDELTFLTDNSGGTPTEALKLDTSQRLNTLSGVKRKITEVATATYTALATDHRISIQYTDTGVHTLTLPAISASNHGQEYWIKDADYNASNNNITINTTGADTIEEQASGTMTGDGEAWTLVANNTTKNWELY